MGHGDVEEPEEARQMALHEDGDEAAVDADADDAGAALHRHRTADDSTQEVDRLRFHAGTLVK